VRVVGAKEVGVAVGYSVGCSVLVVGVPVEGVPVGALVAQEGGLWMSSIAVVYEQVTSPRRRAFRVVGAAVTGWMAVFSTLLYSQTLRSSPSKSIPRLFSNANMMWKSALFSNPTISSFPLRSAALAASNAVAMLSQVSTESRRLLAGAAVELVTLVELVGDIVGSIVGTAVGAGVAMVGAIVGAGVAAVVLALGLAVGTAVGVSVGVGVAVGVGVVGATVPMVGDTVTVVTFVQVVSYFLANTSIEPKSSPALGQFGPAATDLASS
jgi:hypothetical protein